MWHNSYRSKGVTPKASSTTYRKVLIMSNANHEVTIMVPNRAIRGIDKLEEHMSKFNPAESIGECHVRTDFSDITLEVEVIKGDNENCKLAAYGWGKGGELIDMQANGVARAFIKHLEKLQG